MSDTRKTSDVMPDVPRIDAADARRKVASEGAFLVCAYEDEAKCRTMNLEGSVSLAAFRSKLSAALPKDHEIIFYCA
jgi:hypothetical protein